jgi:hypothetical protein
MLVKTNSLKANNCSALNISANTHADTTVFSATNAMHILSSDWKNSGINFLGYQPMEQLSQ